MIDNLSNGIKVDLAKCRAFSEEIEEDAEYLKNTVLNEKILSSVEGIRNAWKGSDALAVLSNFEEVHLKQIEKNIKTLTVLSSFLASYPEKYISCDEKYS